MEMDKAKGSLAMGIIRMVRKITMGKIAKVSGSIGMVMVSIGTRTRIRVSDSKQFRTRDK